MSRNYFQAKNYKWEKFNGYIRCYDPDCPEDPRPIIMVADEGGDDNMINAYMQGVTEGRKQGRAKLQHQLKKALNDPAYD